jgi:hypothetical protein
VSEVRRADSLAGPENGTQLFSTALFPDAKTLVTAGTDGRVKLWRTATEQEVLSQSSVDPDLHETLVSQDEKLRRFHAEAAELMQLPQPPEEENVRKKQEKNSPFKK